MRFLWERTWAVRETCHQPDRLYCVAQQLHLAASSISTASKPGDLGARKRTHLLKRKKKDLIELLLPLLFKNKTKTQL